MPSEMQKKIEEREKLFEKKLGGLRGEFGERSIEDILDEMAAEEASMSKE